MGADLEAKDDFLAAMAVLYLTDPPRRVANWGAEARSTVRSQEGFCYAQRWSIRASSNIR